MKNGQVLVGDDFPLISPQFTRQLGHLGTVEIVGGRQPVQSQIKKGFFAKD